MSTVITAVPTKPWRASKRERGLDIAIFLVSIVSSYAMVALTPLKGKLAYFVIFFIAYAALTSVFKATQRGSAAAKDALVNSLVAIGAIVTVIPVASIMATVLAKGLPGISFGLFTHDMALATPTDPLSNGGLLHAITGTLILVTVAMIISVPIGILTALYLTEIKGRFTGPIRFLVQAMSGVPSIVAGLFILSAILYPITKAYSGLMGSLSLTILMIPTIARTSQEVLNLIPNELREAGTALGGTQWRTVAGVVLPAARSGLVTAIILGIARIIGETAPLLLVSGGGDALNLNPTEGAMGSLPYYIWKSFLTGGTPEAAARAWAGMLVLLSFIFILFGLARYLSGRKVA